MGPSEAVDRILREAGVDPGDQADYIGRLNDLPEPLRSEVAHLLVTFESYQNTHAEAYAGVSDAAKVARAEALLVGDGRHHTTPLADLGAFFAARAALLDAVVELDAALQDGPAIGRGASTACTPVDIPPVLSIDLCGNDDTYTEDYVFQFDVAGDDTYHNNAGGSAALGARALVDLDGNDTYGNTSLSASERRGDGVNGGGSFFSTGLLIDARGDDTYSGGASGVNGGGHLEGHGLLIDAAGNDRYDADTHGVNGGASCCYSLGHLVDLDGDDHYVASGAHGLNGGARGASPESPSLGALYDGAGDDHYVGGSNAANGGGFLGGRGFLYDHGGDDRYEANASGVNGGARGGTGLLVDAEGHDQYIARSFGVNGGGWTASAIGTLVDLSGDDTYTGASAAVNGGSGLNGIGRLYDHAGNDAYTADGHGGNGGTYLSGAALLWDRIGDDTYTADPIGTNGAADTGFALLLDTGGRDHYDDGIGDCWDCTVIPKGTFGAQKDEEMS